MMEYFKKGFYMELGKIACKFLTTLIVKILDDPEKFRAAFKDNLKSLQKEEQNIVVNGFKKFEEES